MSLKKVMYNQHDPYMHTPISAFACYDTPLQASYQSDTCKSCTLNRSFKMRWVFDYPATSHWAVVSVGLVSRLASPNSLHRRDNQPYYIHSS